MNASRTPRPTPPQHPRPNPGLAAEPMLGGSQVLHLAARELSATLDRQFAPLGLTAQQAGLLVRSAPGPLSPNELAPLLGTDTAGMTRLLDRLEAKGLVLRARHPQDRRSIVITLTGAGLSLVPRLPPVFGRVSASLFAGFTDDEVHQVTGMLQRMLDNLRAAGTGDQAASARPRRTGGPE